MLGRHFQADCGDQCKYQVPSVVRSRSRALWTRLCAETTVPLLNAALIVCTSAPQCSRPCYPKDPHRPQTSQTELPMLSPHRCWRLELGDKWDVGRPWGPLGQMVQTPQPLSRDHLYQIHRGTLKPGDAVVTTNLATRREGRRAGQVDWKGDSDLWNPSLGLLSDAHRYSYCGPRDAEPWSVLAVVTLGDGPWT